MTSLMYSNRLMPFNLHEIAIEYRMAPRLAPSCEPKNNEFFLDNDQHLHAECGGSATISLEVTTEIHQI